MAKSKKVLPEIASRQPLKIDLGGGYRRGINGWVNIDVSHECDLYWDLRAGIPFGDGKVDNIYSSHLFEHLPYQDGQRLFAECLRVLRPGGSISIAVPNARMYLEHYVNGAELPPETFTWTPAYNGTTRIDAVNYVAYMAGEHCYMFDSENLVHRITAAGFVNVRARDFDPDVDLPERQFESIYAIGFKPID